MCDNRIRFLDVNLVWLQLTLKGVERKIFGGGGGGAKKKKTQIPCRHPCPLCQSIEDLSSNLDNQNQTFHYTRRITPKRVTMRYPFLRHNAKVTYR